MSLMRWTCFPLLLATVALLGCVTIRTVNISGSGISTDPAMTSSGGVDGTIYVAWVEHFAPPLVASEVFFSKASMRSSRFTTPISLGSSSGGQPVRPAIAQTGRNLYVVWTKSVGYNTDVFLAASSAQRATFTSPPINVSNTPNTSGGTPAVAGFDNDVHVTWSEPPNTVPAAVFVASSVDAGQTFAQPKRLSKSARTSDQAQQPRIAVEGKHVYVIWCELDNSLNFSVSSDSGVTYGNPQVLHPPSHRCRPEQVIGYGSNVYVLWTAGDASGNDDVYFRSSGKRGVQFNTTVNVSASNRRAWRPHMDGDLETVHIVWASDPYRGIEDVYVSNVNVAKNLRGTVQNLSNSIASSTTPQVRASDNYVHVVWRESVTTDNTDLYYRRSLDSGQTFSNVLTIPSVSSPQPDIQPQLEVRGLHRYVVWQRGSGQPPTEIMFDSWRWGLGP